MKKTTKNTAEYFNFFWSASSLNKVNILAFYSSIQNYLARREAQTLSRFEWNDEGLHVPQAPTQLLPVYLRKRRSIRSFSSKPISMNTIQNVLSWLRVTDQKNGWRTYPSAGGYYSNHILVWVMNHKDPALNNTLHYYDPVTSRLHRAGEMEKVAELPDWWNIELEGRPSVAFISLIDETQQIAKYGERAGRFMLIEAGAISQLVSMACAVQRLGGVLVGGVQDVDLLSRLPERFRNLKLGFFYIAGDFANTKK